MQGTVDRHRRAMISELLVDLRRVDKQRAQVDVRISEAVVASGTTLTDIHGIGPNLAATIIGQVGDIGRFPSRGHFASYCGTAPVEASSRRARPAARPCGRSSGSCPT